MESELSRNLAILVISFYNYMETLNCLVQSFHYLYNSGTNFNNYLFRCVLGVLGGYLNFSQFLDLSFKSGRIYPTGRWRNWQTQRT